MCRHLASGASDRLLLRVALTLQAGKELHRGPGFQAVIPCQVGTPSPQIKAWRGEPQRVSFEDAKALAHASELTAAEALPADAIWEFDEPDTRGGQGCRICDYERHAGQA